MWHIKVNFKKIKLKQNTFMDYIMLSYVTLKISSEPQDYSVHVRNVAIPFLCFGDSNGNCNIQDS